MLIKSFGQIVFEAWVAKYKSLGNNVILDKWEELEEEMKESWEYCAEAVFNT